MAAVIPSRRKVRDPERAADELPAHLARLVAAPLLSAERERELFRRMNALNDLARERLEANDPPTPVDRRAAERALAEAREIRDAIIQSNIRLVMWVVKRFASPRRPFDELLSDGLLTLMKAVQKFDCERGVRFSTYACRALVSNTCRTIAADAKRERRFAPWTEAASEAALASAEPPAPSLAPDSLRQTVSRLVDRLDDREKRIVCSRFAVGDCERVITREVLANDLGVSKERVRQLQLRAMGKLLAYAMEIDLESALEGG